MRKAAVVNALSRRNLGRSNSEGSNSKKESKQQQQQPPDKPKSNNSNSNKKAVEEAAALTAKNYRLAKELSELRVRHREECKSVTRLTMENMNLASRCREAISHVAMLKKELAQHQRRSAEALALSSQQNGNSSHNNNNNDTASNNSSNSSSNNNSNTSSPQKIQEMERMDRLLALSAERTREAATTTEEETVGAIVVAPEKRSPNTLPPSPPLSPGVTPVDSDHFEDNKLVLPELPRLAVEEKEQEEEEERLVLRKSKPMETDLLIDTSADGLKVDSLELVDDGDDELSPSMYSIDEPIPPTSGGSSGGSHGGTFFPASASPKMDAYNEGFPSNVVSRSKPAARQKMELQGGFLRDELSPASPNGGRNSSSSSKNGTGGGVFEKMKRVDKSTLSSIDAFEASFTATFPDSFSPRDDEKKGSEIYNPFFPSPKKLKRRESKLGRSEEQQQQPERSGKRRDAEVANDSFLKRREKDPMGKKRESDNSKRKEKRREKAEQAPLSTSLASLPNLENSRLSLYERAKEAAVGKRPGSTSSPSLSESIKTPSDASKEPRGGTLESSIHIKTPGSAASSLVSRSSNGSSTSPPGKKTKSHDADRSLAGDVVSGNAARSTPASQRYAPSTPQQPLKLDEEKYRTPPHSGHASVSSSSGASEPKRPEKAGYEIARVRYEKAMHAPRDRTSHDSAPSDEKAPSSAASSSSHYSRDERSATMDPASTHTRDGGGGGGVGEAPRSVSPTTMDKIPSLKDRVAAFQQSASPNRDPSVVSSPPNTWLGNLTPERGMMSLRPPTLLDPDDGDIPMNTSLGKDPLAGKTVHGGGGGGGSVLSSRGGAVVKVRPWDMPDDEEDDMNAHNAMILKRAIRQPVSYAEPPLHVKLRRGDVYFPKNEDI